MEVPRVGCFGLTAVRGRDGSWFATKFVEKGPTRGSATGIVRSRHLLVNVSKAASKDAAMRETKRLYVIGALL